MRSPLFLLIFVFVLTSCNTTERVVHFPSDSVGGVQLPSNNLATLQSQYGNVDGVYLNYNQALEHNVSIAFTSTIPHWKFYEIVDRSFVVFNPGGPAVREFRLEVPSNSKLQQAAITMNAPGASSRTFTKDDLIAQTGASGEMVYTMDYANVAAGTVITEKYELTRGDLERNPPVSHDVRLQYDIPVQNLDFQYIYPIWWQVQVKNLSLNQPLKYDRIEDQDRRKIILKYADQNVPAFQQTNASPYFKQVAPYFQLQVSNMSMGSAVKYRAPEDWTDFAEDYSKYAIAANDKPSRAVKKAADQMLGAATGELDRVERALGFVKDNIQLVDGNQHRSLDVLLSKREGNAYQITSLMQAMLQAYGVDSEYLLIHPAYEGYFDPEFYSESQLKEPALGVFADGEQYYVFPGRQGSVNDPVPNHYGGQTAMVVTDDGFGGFTEVLSTQFAAVPTQVDINRGGGVAEVPVPPVEEVTLPNTEQQVITPPPVSQPVEEVTAAMETGGSIPVNTPPTNTVVGSPNAGVNVPVPVPDPTPAPVEEPPVAQVVETFTEPNVLPEWLGSIKRSLGGWTWIVASRTSMEEAEELANTYMALYRQGISVDVLSGESGGVTRYRIAIGQYSSRSLAQADKSRYGSDFPGDAWLLEIKPSM